MMDWEKEPADNYHWWRMLVSVGYAAEVGVAKNHRGRAT
jgi:hypothetical protein